MTPTQWPSNNSLTTKKPSFKKKPTNCCPKMLKSKEPSMTYCKQFPDTLWTLTFRKFLKTRPKRPKDITSGTSIRLYWMPLKTLWTPWNTESVERNSLDPMLYRIWNPSLKFRFNFLEKKFSFLPVWMKFRNPLIKPPQLFWDVPRNCLTGDRAKKMTRNRLSTIWLPKIKKLSRLFYCWPVLSKEPETRSQTSYKDSMTWTGSSKEKLTTTSKNSPKENPLSNNMKTNLKNSQESKTLSTDSPNNTKSEPWS